MLTGENRSHRGYHAAAHAAHRLILDQHMELRRLLALGLVQTCMPCDRRSGLAALLVLVGRIQEAFVEHLSDEEAVLLPLLRVELPAGLLRTQILREEHARQRRELDALNVPAEDEIADGLADRFDRLARALLIDIAQEERDLARAVAVLDENAACGRDGRALWPGDQARLLVAGIRAVGCDAAGATRCRPRR